MFTDAQLLYIEEVLGASVDSYRAVAPAKPTAVAVLTPPLNPDEQALMAKILGSVQLTDYTLISQLSELPGDTGHVLSFQEANGRWTEGEQVWWGLPSISSMIGPGPAVAAAKKEAWVLLQQFQKERA